MVRSGIRQRDEETKRQRDKETKRRRDKETGGGQCAPPVSLCKDLLCKESYTESSVCTKKCAQIVLNYDYKRFLERPVYLDFSSKWKQEKI